MQQRAEHQLLAAANVDSQAVGHRADVGGDGLGVTADHQVLDLDRVGEHADRGHVGPAQLAVQAGVLEGGAGLVAEGEQDLVLVLVKPAVSVGADHDPAEPVLDIDGDRDEIADLLVGGAALLGVQLALVVLTHDPVALHHPVGEVLGQRAVSRVVPEALAGQEVEIAVAVLVDTREQKALLALQQLHSDAEHEPGQVVGIAEEPALAV